MTYSNCGISFKKNGQGIDFDPDKRIIIKLTLTFIVFYLIGLILYYILSISSSETLNSYISNYFSNKINTDLNLNSILPALTLISYSDLKALFLVFLAGFTMFSGIGILCILAFEAVSLGFSSLYLVNAMTYDLLPSVAFSDLIIFLLSNSLIAGILVYFSYKTIFFNDSFRALQGRKKLILRHKNMYRHIFYLLTFGGAIILINSIVTIINFF